LREGRLQSRWVGRAGGGRGGGRRCEKGGKRRRKDNGSFPGTELVPVPPGCGRVLGPDNVPGGSRPAGKASRAVWAGTGSRSSLTKAPSRSRQAAVLSSSCTLRPPLPWFRAWLCPGNSNARAHETDEAEKCAWISSGLQSLKCECPTVKDGAEGGVEEEEGEEKARRYASVRPKWLKAASLSRVLAKV